MAITTREFTTKSTSVASWEVIDRDTLRRRLLLWLFALGTNMGIRAIVATGEHEQTEAALRHVRRHFITRGNLRRPIATFASATFAARDPAWWGQGTACASGSKKFGSWDSNLMRTIFACDCLENWDSGNTVIFYGRDGDLTGPDREHAEVPMPCTCSRRGGRSRRSSERDARRWRVVFQAEGAAASVTLLPSAEMNWARSGVSRSAMAPMIWSGRMRAT